MYNTAQRAVKAVEIVLDGVNETVISPPPDSIWVGQAGNLVCDLITPSGKSGTTMRNLPVGYHPLAVTRIYPSSTVAYVVAIYAG